MNRERGANRDPSVSRRVGSRFRRRLTPAELRSIVMAADAPPGTAVEAAFRTLWDLLLTEAEGVSFADAVERGLRFHPDDYAIPAAQAASLIDLLNQVAGALRGSERSVAMAWLELGPATYDDSDERR